jgi:hypothetical protein
MLEEQQGLGQIQQQAPQKQPVGEGTAKNPDQIINELTAQQRINEIQAGKEADRSRIINEHEAQREEQESREYNQYVIEAIESGQLDENQLANIMNDPRVHDEIKARLSEAMQQPGSQNVQEQAPQGTGLGQIQ